MDEAVDTMLKAWTGEPFEYRGTTVRGHPAAADPAPPAVLARRHEQGRGARAPPASGFPSSRPANMPELESYYHEQCMEYGHAGLLHDAGRPRR